MTVFGALRQFAQVLQRDTGDRVDGLEVALPDRLFDFIARELRIDDLGGPPVRYCFIETDAGQLKITRIV